MLKERTNYILDTLQKIFPDAHCELVHHNIYELSVAVILSAQAKDERVNMVTPILFAKYPDLTSLSRAEVKDVKAIIQHLGLADAKSKNIIAFSQKVLSEFSGLIPKTLEELITLPGVGRKTANVILSVGHNLPGLAVDTHVSRVSKRLGLVSDDDSVEVIEHKLKQMFEPDVWGYLHHCLIFFGRYMCLAKKPLCEKCPFNNICIKK